VVFVQRIAEKLPHKDRFCVVFIAKRRPLAKATPTWKLPRQVAGQWCPHTKGGPMLKILLAAAASLAMVGAAVAADLPRKEPPPPVAPVGKAPIGKLPFGKGPVVARY